MFLWQEINKSFTFGVYCVSISIPAPNLCFTIWCIVKYRILSQIFELDVLPNERKLCGSHFDNFVGNWNYGGLF